MPTDHITLAAVCPLERLEHQLLSAGFGPSEIALTPYGHAGDGALVTVLSSMRSRTEATLEQCDVDFRLYERRRDWSRAEQRDATYFTLDVHGANRHGMAGYPDVVPPGSCTSCGAGVDPDRLVVDCRLPRDREVHQLVTLQVLIGPRIRDELLGVGVDPGCIRPVAPSVGATELSWLRGFQNLPKSERTDWTCRSEWASPCTNCDRASWELEHGVRQPILRYGSRDLAMVESVSASWEQVGRSQLPSRDSAGLLPARWLVVSARVRDVLESLAPRRFVFCPVEVST